MTVTDNASQPTGDIESGAPLYYVERQTGDVGGWCVIGPNGQVGVHPTEDGAQAKADYLNEQVAEETESDF